jgi:uncharacterized protein YegP (UPF0339 family)
VLDVVSHQKIILAKGICDMKFYIHLDTEELWRWYLASHGQRIATSGKSYRTFDECLEAIGSVMDATRQTPVERLVD